MWGYVFECIVDFEIVRGIKEVLCFMSYDLEMDKKLVEEIIVMVENYIVSELLNLRECFKLIWW